MSGLNSIDVVQCWGRRWQLLPPSYPGLRGGRVVMEARRDGTRAIRFGGRELPFEEVRDSPQEPRTAEFVEMKCRWPQWKADISIGAKQRTFLLGPDNPRCPYLTERRSTLERRCAALSSSGLGRGPLKAKTRVRVPVGSSVHLYRCEQDRTESDWKA